VASGEVNRRAAYDSLATQIEVDYPTAVSPGRPSLVLDFLKDALDAQSQRAVSGFVA
jgi:hypothetical protein